ncbi:hypothetical protein [Azospirillum palustre]
MDDATRKRLADALSAGLGMAGGAARGVAGALFDPAAQADRMARFATGYDQATGEDLTQRQLLPNAQNGGRVGEIAAFLNGGMRRPGVPMRDMPATMPGGAPTAPGGQQDGRMGVDAAYQALTGTEDPEAKRRALIVYQLRGGA